MRNIAVRLFSLLLAGFLFSVADGSAQTIAFRQTNLASDVITPGFANHVDPSLRNPYGMAFLRGQLFFIANTGNGRVTTQDATGSAAGPGDFTVPDASSSGPGTPTGIVADSNSQFGTRDLRTQFIAVADDGAVFAWGPNAEGDVPQHATLVVDNSSSGAVYKGVAILTPTCCAPFLAVTDFHTGLVEPYSAFFVALAPPGSFTDPNLPSGYAPFGIQVIGNQVLVTYALQDAARHDPVFGAGNGVVNIFDLEGNFVRRFATGGNLNAPWGVTQGSANFGPFSNAILIGNAGDGTISAFDLITGNFLGQIRDGDGNVIVNPGLHALTFRSDGFGDASTLYFTAGINDGQDGLVGAITTGLVSATTVVVPSSPIGAAAAITVSVTAGAANTGTPSGFVVIKDGGVQLSNLAIVNGAASLDTTFTKAGNHVIEAQYSGDANFLPSSSQLEVQVSGQSTALTLAAPANAAPGATVVLIATITSAGGTPTGQIVFQDGDSNLGTAALDGAGMATLRVNTLAAGSHSLSASYAGDGKFEASTSRALTVNIVNEDFSLAANPPSASVIAGQSTQFLLSVTPVGGFSSATTFACPALEGITCTFSPPTVTPGNGAVSTRLTVATSASVTHYGVVLFNLIGATFLLTGWTLLAFLVWQGGKLQSTRRCLSMATVILNVAGLVFMVGGCGGYGSGTQSNRGTVSINVTAQSGVLSHSSVIHVTVQ